MRPSANYLRDLLLVGGGHAHVQVLRRFGMKPEPGIRLTLISRESLSPYTGMLPGYIAGDYHLDDISIDLHRLTKFAQCRFIVDSVRHIDRLTQTVVLDSNRPPIRYDVLSLNVGGDNALNIEGGELVHSVKPIGRFLNQWPDIVDDIYTHANPRLVVVGGGPGSVELAIALGDAKIHDAQISLVTRNSGLVSELSTLAQAQCQSSLAKNHTAVVPNFELGAVESIPNRQLKLHATDGRILEATHVFSATGVEAPQWIASSGLEVDELGCLKVNACLQSESDPLIFGAGDAVHMSSNPRPKSGVYSVRQGPYLAENLRRSLIEKRLKRYKPQRDALALLRSSSRGAISSKRVLQKYRTLSWLYKDWIDRRFMRRFSELPEMSDPDVKYRGGLQEHAPTTSMRCGGCGAKLGADLLERVLHRLDIHQPEQVTHGIGDDSAVVQMTGSTIVLSCDGFRSMIDDPWRFGRIAAHHALNDLYAMGTSPTAALALVTIPLMSSDLMEEDLFQLMSGALSVLDSSGTALVGGHSAEGSELSIALTVLGSRSKTLMTKDKLKEGDLLVLNKPIGVGSILAGYMDGRVAASAIEMALDVMDLSNEDAMRVFEHHHVEACTDITGFGFAGHLGEMLRASGLSATINLDNVPMLREAEHAIHRGIESSLQENNEQIFQDCTYDCSSLDPRLRLLADPQTSGGLLAAVSSDLADECIQNLHQYGYPLSAIVGHVDSASTDGSYIRIV